MDAKIVGKFIKELRKEKGLTQEALSKALNVDRTTVVKWERGNSIPLNDSLVLLSNYFKITIDELLNGQRYPKEPDEVVVSEEVKTETKNKVIFSLLDARRKSMFIAKYFMIITFILLGLFFAYYFFNTYNSIHVYRVYGDNDNYKIRDSLLIVSNEKVYLRLGNMLLMNDKEIYLDKVTIYYKNENNVLFHGDASELLMEKRGNIDIFRSFKPKDSYDNIYLKFNYNDDEEIIKLNVEKDFQNKGLFFREKQVGTFDGELENFSFKLSDKFIYDKDEDVYKLTNDNFEITYSVDDNRCKIYEKNIGFDVKYLYYFDLNILKYEEIINSKAVNETKIFLNSMNDEQYEIFREFKVNYLDKYFSETNT